MKVLQVFEHERLRIGEERNGVLFTPFHFSALVKLNEKHNNQYFTILHRGIRFSSYVGVVQIQDLSLEILPKADNKPGKNDHLWGNVLLEMLVQSKWINDKALGSTNLQYKKGTILEVYIYAFLEEVERLLHHGLTKQYRQVEGNIPHWKGRLQFAKQLRNNLLGQAKIHTVHQVYDTHHLLNQIIRQTLQLVSGLTNSESLIIQSKQLLSQFPHLKQLEITQNTFSKIRFNRNTTRYRNAIDISKVFFNNYMPDLQFGTYHSFMFLFNMDSLFEAFIFEQIKKAAPRCDFQVIKQVSTTFWDRKKIRPDIIVHHVKSGKKFVIDTKWKKLKSPQPAVDDLRQIYVYNQYFGAEKGLLLYPAVYPFSAKNEAFKKPEYLEVGYRENHCTMGFIDVLDKNGKLSREVGVKVLQMLTSEGK